MSFAFKRRKLRHCPPSPECGWISESLLKHWSDGEWPPNLYHRSHGRVLPILSGIILPPGGSQQWGLWHSGSPKETSTWSPDTSRHGPGMWAGRIMGAPPSAVRLLAEDSPWLLGCNLMKESETKPSWWTAPRSLTLNIVWKSKCQLIKVSRPWRFYSGTSNWGR